MFNVILLLVLSLSMFSCTSQEETKDAVFWRKKYEALDAFVKRKGLSREAERAARELEQIDVKYHFTVFKTHYSLNGAEVANTELKAVVDSIEGPKKQPINIMTVSDVRYERLLLLMNELSLKGFKNFNLITERNIKPAP